MRKYNELTKTEKQLIKTYQNWNKSREPRKFKRMSEIRKQAIDLNILHLLNNKQEVIQ